jgi:hypothetical protein
VDWLGVNTGQAMRTGTVTPAQFYDRLTGLGGNVLREDVGWNLIQPSAGTWAWGYLDTEINAAPPGVEIILNLINSPRWARDPVADLATCVGQSEGKCRMPPALNKLEDWRKFVRETVKRYASRVVAVEVWNEPNLKSFWRPNGNEPARWAQLVQIAAEAVAEVDPSILVITGGLGCGPASNSNVGMMQAPYLDAAYAANPNLSACVDAIGIHPYAGQVAPTAPGNRFTDTLAEIRAVRDVRDPGTPLWATETGYYTQGAYPVTEARQRDWLLYKYDQLVAAPDVEAMILHALVDPVWASSTEERNYGVVYGSSEPKPAWTAFHDRLVP